MWNLCLETVDLCLSLNIPYKLSENVLKKSMTICHDSNPCRETTQFYTSAVTTLSVEPKENVAMQESALGLVKNEQNAECTAECHSPNETSERQKLGDQNVEAYVQSSLISSAPIDGNNASTIKLELPTGHSSGELVEPLGFVASSECSIVNRDIEMQARTGKEMDGKLEIRSEKNGDSVAIKEAKEPALNESKAFESASVNETESNVVQTNSAHLNSVGLHLGKLPHSSYAKLENGASSSLNDDDSLYYHSVCNTALSVIDKIKKWKSASKMMTETDMNFDDDDDAEQKSPDDNQKDMTSMDCGNDSLLSDVSMASDDTELLSAPVKDYWPTHNTLLDGTNKPTENTISFIETDHALADTGENVQESDSRMSPSKQFSPQFQNNLDILAMVASGFFINSSKKCSEEGITSEIANANDQPGTLIDDEKRNKSSPASGMKDTALMMKEKKLFGDQDTIASHLCDGKLLQLKYSRHHNNIELFREVWKKGFVSYIVVFDFVLFCLWFSKQLEIIIGLNNILSNIEKLFI